MLEIELLFDTVLDNNMLVVRHPKDDKPLLGVICRQADGTWFADMAGVGRRIFLNKENARAWCVGVFDGASSDDVL